MPSHGMCSEEKSWGLCWGWQGGWNWRESQGTSRRMWETLSVGCQGRKSSATLVHNSSIPQGQKVEPRKHSTPPPFHIQSLYIHSEHDWVHSACGKQGDDAQHNIDNTFATSAGSRGEIEVSRRRSSESSSKLRWERWARSDSWRCRQGWPTVTSPTRSPHQPGAGGDGSTEGHPAGNWCDLDQILNEW